MQDSKLQMFYSSSKKDSQKLTIKLILAKYLLTGTIFGVKRLFRAKDN